MYIYSKWSERDLRILNEANSVADLYELLGLYISYCEAGVTEDFKKYYGMNVNTKPYHFRNIGEKKIKHILKLKEIIVSRKELRLLSRTYFDIPVITSDKMGIIFTELTNEIYKYLKMQKILSIMQIEFTPLDFLYFQYYFVTKYVCTDVYINSYKKKNVFRLVKEEWEKNRIFKI